MPTQTELEIQEKKRRNYRLYNGEENCSNCEHTANLGAGLRCCFSPDVQFLVMHYTWCEAYAKRKGSVPCK